MNKYFMISAICVLLSAPTAHAGSAPDGHAPIGVMGDHSHKKGEWMPSYRYSNMRMQGNRSGNNKISTADVLGNFMVSPEKMTMEMHMLGLMYGASDTLTIMGMLPYTILSMDHITRSGVAFNTKSEGVGDVKFSGIYTLHTQDNQKVMLNSGISFPTGSIDKRDDTPAGANQKLPYPMQLGSGTYDLLPGITYTDKVDNWSWGGQLNAIIRLGENSNDYRLGNKYGVSTWIAHKLTEYASTSLRLDAQTWGNINGSDSDLNPTMVPTARTDLRGGKRIDVLAGINLIVPDGTLKGNRLAIEAGAPVYQHLEGPQLETDYRMTIGWQLAF